MVDSTGRFDERWSGARDGRRSSAAVGSLGDPGGRRCGESTTEPYYAGEVDYGDRAEHCWNGDHGNPNHLSRHLSRLSYNTMYVPKILARIEASAPEGADLTSWRY